MIVLLNQTKKNTYTDKRSELGEIAAMIEQNMICFANEKAHSLFHLLAESNVSYYEKEKIIEILRLVQHLQSFKA